MIQLRILRRRSRPVLDPMLLNLTAQIASKMGVCRRVDLREADFPGLPATVGWLRPIILLPRDWAAWPSDDRTAVLAHELAHVRNRDFLTGLLTQLSLALHFYHPLLRRLAARVWLRQELAADALAAPFAGGRGAYLRSLARMALRPQPRYPDVPARLLLSATGSALLRRIDMLQVTDDVRTTSGWFRGLALGLLLALTLAVSALRTSAEPPPAGLAKSSNVEPFDVRYIGKDAKAVVGIRPSMFLGHPKADALRKQCREGLALFLAEQFGGKVPEGFSLEDIDQFVADAAFTTAGTGEPGSRSFMLGNGCILCRLRKDVDWTKLITTMLPKLKFTEIKLAGKTCLLSEKIKEPALPFRICAHALDARTLLVATDQIKLEASLKNGPIEGRDWGAGWKSVNRSAAAVAIDNHDRDFAKRFAKDIEKETQIKALLECPARIAIGFDFDEKMTERLFVDFADEAMARRALGALTAIRAEAIQKVEKEKNENKDKTDSDAEYMLELLRSGVPHRDGTQIQAIGTSTHFDGNFFPWKATAKETP
jgi:hypothetical protein